MVKIIIVWLAFNTIFENFVKPMSIHKLTNPIQSLSLPLHNLQQHWVISLVSQTGGTEPQLTRKWGQNEKTGRKQHTGKTRDHISFRTSIAPLRSFIPSFLFALPVPWQCLGFTESSLVRIRFWKSSKLIPSKQLCSLFLHSSWGWNRV
jgi:hypothetical protein